MWHVKLTTYCLWVMAIFSALAMPDGQAAQLDFLVSKDGTYVIDIGTKLVWSRCVEGMRWNGQTCAGTPQLVSYGEALALANARAKADGLRWRVPGVKELQRLASNEVHSSRDEKEIFPASPPDWHWTVSATIDTKPFNQYDYKNIERGVTAQNANRIAFLHGWGVNLQTGEARGDILKRTKLPVRLVCQED